jgi:hypothetical protein
MIHIGGSSVGQPNRAEREQQFVARRLGTWLLTGQHKRSRSTTSPSTYWIRTGLVGQTGKCAGGRDRFRTCGLCRLKSRTADSARLVTGFSPGRSWNFASRSGPLVTAVVRWSMPQLCPKITSLPAQSPYILFKRSRATSCGSRSSEPPSGSCSVANCQQPAQQSRPG